MGAAVLAGTALLGQQRPAAASLDKARLEAAINKEVIDGDLKVADIYSEKILDPWNDQYIPAANYPSLKPYPSGQSNIVSVLQTAKPTYNWTVNNFTRPDKRNLVIYELLVRDFVSAQNWQTMKDTLTYLKRLGINAIELMPVN